MLGFIISLLSGALMSIQGVWNTEVTKQTGIWLAAAWVQLTAFLVCMVMWSLTKHDAIGKLWQVTPFYMLFGGVAGAVITWTVIKGMGALGPAMATLLIVISQLMTSYIIELFGLFGVEKTGFEWKKLLGAAVAIVGIIIFRL